MLKCRAVSRAASDREVESLRLECEDVGRARAFGEPGGDRGGPRRERQRDVGLRALAARERALESCLKGIGRGHGKPWKDSAGLIFVSRETRPTRIGSPT